MKWSVLAVCAVAFAASAPTVGARPNHVAHCYAKEAKVNGKAVIVSCGPASAKLRYQGRTYTFHNGTCLRTAGSVDLSLGTQLTNDQGKGNAGFAYLDITMLSNRLPAQIQAYDGKLDIGGSAKFSGIARKGTFSGTVGSFGGVGVGKAASFSGSWNCGGPIQAF